MQNKKILVLDFDGVIVDSQEECLIVGYNSYLKLNKHTKIFNEEKLTFENFPIIKNKYKKTIDEYKKLRPYVIDAFCWYVILHILENKIKIKNQTDYAKIRENLMSYYDDYVKAFYKERAALQKNLSQWIKLEKPFGKIVSGMKKLENKLMMVIATNNRKKSIAPLLKEFKIKTKLVTDSLISIDKKKQLSYIKRKLKVDFEDMHFVDDQVKHFPALIKLKINCYLASWGYNNKEQRDHARKLKVKFLREGDFYKKFLTI